LILAKAIIIKTID